MPRQDPYVFTKKVVFMQRMADAVRLGHQRYIGGEVPLEKVPALAEKFERLFDTHLDKVGRSRARKAGKATARLFFWQPVEGASRLHWVLLATPGEFPAGDREAWRDATNTKQGEHIHLTGYELVRITKKHHDAPVWTWRYTRTQHEALRLAVRDAIRRKDELELKRLIDTIWRTPGFGGARAQALKFKDLIKEEWKRSRSAADPLPEIPAHLGYVRRIKDVGKPVSALIREREVAMAERAPGAVTQ